MGNGEVMPWRARTLLRAGLMPNSSKDMRYLFITRPRESRGADCTFQSEFEDSQGDQVLIQESTAVAALAKVRACGVENQIATCSSSCEVRDTGCGNALR